MGTYFGESGRSRVAIWAEINHAFSPLHIDETAAAYLKYKKSKGTKAHFIDFVVDYGLIPKNLVNQWRSGANAFAPGTFDLVHEAVDRNLTSTYSRFKSGPAVPQGKRALPMLFERGFGKEGEYLAIKPTRHGIKIVLSSLGGRGSNSYARSEPGLMAASWGRAARKRTRATSKR